MLLRNRFAVISGASGGIGSALARMAAAEGARLILTGRNAAALDRVRASLPTLGGDAHIVIPADLTDDASINTLIAGILRHAEQLPLGALFLNAGAALNAPLEETTVADWDAIFAVNVRAPFRMVRGLLPALRSAAAVLPRQVRIICTGSAVSTSGYVHQGAYAAAKHALLGFTKVLAKEVAADDIGVHSLQPGGVATEMIAAMRPDIDPSDLIQPDEVAAVARDLLALRGNAMIDEVRVRRRGKPPWD